MKQYVLDQQKYDELVKVKTEIISSIEHHKQELLRLEEALNVCNSNIGKVTRYLFDKNEHTEKYVELVDKYLLDFDGVIPEWERWHWWHPEKGWNTNGHGISIHWSHIRDRKLYFKHLKTVIKKKKISKK